MLCSVIEHGMTSLTLQTAIHKAEVETVLQEKTTEEKTHSEKSHLKNDFIACIFLR